ncbi:MAG TPA: hypothetical protein VGJ70_24040, partial [Solirubrobacteraceae bacterium]
EGSSPFSRSPELPGNEHFLALREPLDAEPGGLFRAWVRIGYENPAAEERERERDLGWPALERNAPEATARGG